VSEVYCPKCGRGHVEKIKKLNKVIIKVEGEYSIKAKANLYRCNDCGYEFVCGVEYNV